MQELLILGTRGVPASHGGFETFAELLALHLRQRGWSVAVYCQRDGAETALTEDEWQGIRRIIVPAPGAGPISTMRFDWRCLKDVRNRPGRLLVLGYNTAIFDALLLGRRRGDVFINMDGIEWKRRKWSLPAKIWFWFNERIAALSGATLIADHPEIALRLARIAPRARTVMIPYGAHRITAASPEPLVALGLRSDDYFISICRIEPENSILEIVKAFAARPRRRRLVVLGRLDPAGSAYHREVAEAANDLVLFPGAIYEQGRIASLRFHARAYCHGHQVGGTNPSLVEALGAGSAVMAQDNAFNRWVAGPEQFYFADVAACAALFDRLDGEGEPEALRRARAAAVARFEEGLTWPAVLQQYETLLETN
ncbi:MAG: DUF1972 domain-containing protein [Rhizobiales bacterium]|nr:DUF1972 domain-containing protein [Hyphomicrobiales bacterium]